MKKHTNFTGEIDMHEPDTSWHTTLVGVVATIAVTFIIYVVMSLIS